MSKSNIVPLNQNETPNPNRLSFTLEEMLAEFENGAVPRSKYWKELITALYDTANHVVTGVTSVADVRPDNVGNIPLLPKDIDAPAMVRMDGADSNNQQTNQDVFGRSLFYGDACKVVHQYGAYYEVLAGMAYVAGIRFFYPGMQELLIEEVPNKVWVDVSWPSDSSVSREPVITLIISRSDLKDYKDENDVLHYVELLADLNNESLIVDSRNTNLGANSSVTHIHRKDAENDFNYSCSYIKVADYGLAQYFKTDFSKYIEFPEEARFTDKAVNYWILKIEDSINVLQTGARLDGVTDDLNSFIAAQQLSRNVFVPEGNAFISDVTKLTGKYFGIGKINDVPVSSVSQGLTTTIIGYDAGKNFSGDWRESNNTLVGRGCGRELTTGKRNTALGQGVFSGNTLKNTPPIPTTGNDNVGIGFHTLKKTESGAFNVGLGTDAGNEITEGNSNTCIGGSAGQQITVGSDNTMIGRSAGLRLGQDASSGDPNTFLSLNTIGNTVIGRDALRNGYDCDYNTVIGYSAMRGTKDESDFTGNITGTYNCIFGYKALYTEPTTASSNVVVGTEAMRDGVENSYNVVIGHNAAREAKTGDNSIVIGSLCLRSVSDISNLFAVSNHSGLPFIEGKMEGPNAADNVLRVDANFSAQEGSKRTCGTAVRPWTTVFSDNGVVQPSDITMMEQVSEIPDEVFKAWEIIRRKIKKWTWKHKKNDGGRVHIGITSQDLLSAFESVGIDPFKYGFACSDPVCEIKQDFNESGELIREYEIPVINAETGKPKHRYSVRQNELFMLEIAYQAWNEQKNN